MSGNDVMEHGGIFVATYARLPPLGTRVAIGMQFPGGVRCEVEAVVAWTQDDLGEDVPAGFGARIVECASGVREIVHQYVLHRPPMLRD
jgi:Tfp pilus assembly protein PilZ